MEFRNAYSQPQSSPDTSSYYSREFSNPNSSVLFSSPSSPSQSYAESGHEQIDNGVLEALTDGLVSSSSNSLEQFLSGKKRFAAKSVEEMLGLIYEREQIKDEMVRKIDLESAALKERLWETGDWRTGVNPQLDKTRGQIEGELMGLEREKRMEEVACWRDIVRIKGDLREALRDFDQEKRKEILINSQNGST